MQNLINFLNGIRFLLFFVFLQAIVFTLITKGSGHQKASILNSTNSFSGWLFSKEQKIKNYFELQKINNKLNEENAILKKKAIRNYQIISENTIKIEGSNYQLQFDYQPAKVIRSETNSRYNILTLNVGSNNGVEKEMAVVSATGVVGFIKDVSTNFSTVICAMNKNFIITSKPINQDVFGTFVWRNNDDINEGTIEKIPAYIRLKKGDTMITRSQEGIFPEGEFLGFVTNIMEEPGSNYKTAKIKMAQDFNALNFVFVVKNKLKSELDSISQISDN
jgi:rod shape-determining protein MreC